MVKPKRKQNILLVDNPIDIFAVIFAIIAIAGLLNHRRMYLYSTEFPTIASDSVLLIIVGMFGFSLMFTTRLLMHTDKSKRIPIVANTFKINQLLDFGFAIVSYLGIQIIIILISQIPIFQVASVDVYLFFFYASVVEELLYRGFLVMFLQIAMVMLFQIKPKKENMFLVNLFACIVSGVVFMSVHTGYWGEPFLMLITFFGGISQSIWYIKSKNLFIPIIAHAIINLIASGSLLQTLN